MADVAQSTEVARHDQRNGLAALDAREGYGTSLAVQLARADVDQQITTARAYPRNPRHVMNAILSLATLDDQTATECVYALSRSGKPIRGPSIRLAEIIASQWGNCRVGARVVHVDRIEKYVEAEGVYHDLESNAATTARVRRSIRTKQGGVFSDDMIVVVGNAACSIARRNAILGGVPKAAWGKAYDAVEKVIAGDVKTLAERRDAALKAFAAFGVGGDQICKALDVPSIEAVTLDHLVTLTGMHSALKSGEATVEELFPKEAAAPPKIPPKPAAKKGSDPQGSTQPADKPEPLVDQPRYLANLEDNLAACATETDLEEVWESHLSTTDGRVSRETSEFATALYEAAQKRINQKKES
jgi:hypothetical protein